MTKEKLKGKLKKEKLESFQYIVHRIDEVEVGDGKLEEEGGLFKDCEGILEVHIFDGRKELFGRRVQEQLEFYEPLIYDGICDDKNEKCWNMREYKLEEKFSNKYNCIEVAEHITHDNNHLAYIDKTIILRLKKRREVYD